MRAFKIWICGAAFLVAQGCSKDEARDPADDMPVAKNWGGGGSAEDPHGSAAGGDPHAGMDMGGGDPHAGMDMGGGDPHAGMDMGGDPHAGVQAGPGGMLPPDPNREIDPNKFLRGTLSASKEMAGRIKPGAVVFLSARPINKATGESLGAPLAVARLDVKKLPMPFELTGRNSMVRGTDFSGDVQIYARVDGDSEASSVQPGDIEGAVVATIPADNLKLVLKDLK
jgi:hypothetical protein